MSNAAALASPSEKIQLTSTRRSLRQDAELAMRNDPIRALIELITNSDDAYGDETGNVLVEINRSRGNWSFSVRDRACGMRRSEISEKLLSLGKRTSGFERGGKVRGNLGRGAKDVSIFGLATFETVKDGRYTRCTIARSQDAEIWPDQEADHAIRKRLGIKKSGTVVTVEVTSGATCPQLPTLQRVLSTHYQLRDILSDPKRKLQLVTDSGLQTLSYTAPESDFVVEKTLALPRYSNAEATLTIRRFKEFPENLGSSDTGRPSGLLIKGRKAIYENTLFGAESRPNGAWFSGECRCPLIDDLAQSYDDTEEGSVSEDNPIGIISRNREGLQRSHPLYVELSQAVNEVLLPLVDEEDTRQRRSKAHVSTKLRQDLKELGRDLGRMMNDDVEEPEPGLQDGGGLGKDAKIQVIPGRIVAYMHERKTITVRVNPSLNVRRIQVHVSPEGLLDVENGSKIKLDNDEARVRLMPTGIGTGAMTVQAAEELETIFFEVRRERPPPPPLPTELQFDKLSYSVRPGRQKRLRIVAPESVILEHGDAVTVSVKGDAIVTVGPPVRLMPNAEGYFEAIIVTEARAQSGSVRLSAYVGDAVARTTAKVSKDREEGGPDIEIEIVNDEAGPYRALTDKNVVRIMGRHPAVRKVLGSPPKYELQDQPLGRAAIAEIVSFEVVRKIVELQFKNREDVDSAEIYHRHQALFSKYLRRCQRLLEV